MRDVPCIKPSSYTHSQHVVRFLARDSKNHVAALVYWLGIAEPSRESSFFAAMQKFSPLMQLILPDERPGVFVNRSAVHIALDCGIVKRIVFKDRSSLDVRYNGPCSDLYQE